MRSKAGVRARLVSVLLTLSLLLSPSIAALSPLSELTPESSVYVGGMPLGIKLYTGGLLVVGLSSVDSKLGDVSPAENAGLKVGDIITELDGKPMESAAEFANAIERADGCVQLGYIRNGEKCTTTLTAVQSQKDGRLRSGMWLRDSTAGIGTVTFTVPETHEFAALGHGVTDLQNGSLISMKRGVAAEARICGIQKGTVGTPGELRGYFTGRDIGTIVKNTAYGVFGAFESEQTNPLCPDPVPIAARDKLKLGEADIYCTLDGYEISSYKIRITRLNDDGPNFELEVSDERLLELTGGIVQGMSGSPIVQNGCLVGAVTHVLINNPRRGYGIYIGDMISAAH